MRPNLNETAARLARELEQAAQLTRVAVTQLENGAKLLDCGSAVAGGLQAGRRFSEICLGGLGQVACGALTIDGRWMPAVTVATDWPAWACLGSQYAGWKIDRDGYFAMASGPGRALIRAEPLYAEFGWEEAADVAVLCLETRQPPPVAVVDYIAERAAVKPSALILLTAPTASIVGSVQIAARVVETALHKMHELGFDVERVVTALGSCPLPPVARTDSEAIGRTNDAVLYGGRVQVTVEADDDELVELADRLPSSTSPDHGTPFGEILERVNYDFYAIDPLLFSPAEVTITSTVSGRSFHRGHVDLDTLDRSFAL